MTTGIQWTDRTWNPVVGCNQVSAGCDHCYAKTLHDMRHRAVLAGKRLAPQYAEPFEVVQLMPARLSQPFSWQERKRVFVNSVSDLFHADVPDAYIDKVFAVMALAPRHTFQILTKRAGRMRSYLADPATYERVRRETEQGEVASLHWAKLPQHKRVRRQTQWWTDLPPKDWPLSNVWVGVSVENRAAQSRIYALRETRAAVRFISFEPLLEAVDPSLAGIDWAIIGGESGKGARPFDVQWARGIVAQCRSAGVAPFVKQLGAQPGFRLEDEEARGNAMPSFHHFDEASGLHIKKLGDSHGGDMAEWPEDLRVREFPSTAGARP